MKHHAGFVAPDPLPTSAPGDPRYPPTRQHEVLIAMAAAEGWRRGAEIGLLKGKTFDALLTALPDLQLIGVDRWERQAPSTVEGHETYARFDMARAEATCRALAERHGPRARVIKSDSAAAAALVDDLSLDFVFIDAGHTTAAVIADIRAWTPKVRPGGAITGHDWWFPSVRAGLDVTLPGWRRHAQSVWSFSKGGRL